MGFLVEGGLLTKGVLIEVFPASGVCLTLGTTLTGVVLTLTGVVIEEEKFFLTDNGLLIIGAGFLKTD